MPKKRKAPAKFDFKPFSDQQRRLIHWWRPTAKPSANNYVIADGSIRSGKTIACIIGFLTWSQTMFSGQSFILAGKTMGRMNIFDPVLMPGWRSAATHTTCTARAQRQRRMPSRA